MATKLFGHISLRCAARPTRQTAGEPLLCRNPPHTLSARLPSYLTLACRLQLGELYVRLKKPAAARRALSRAVELSPECERSGEKLVSLLDPAAAEAAAAVALARQPTALWAARILVRCAQRRGFPEQAQAALRALIRACPREAAAWEVLAAAYANTCKPKAALASAVQSLAMASPTSERMAYAAAIAALLSLGVLPPHGSYATCSLAAAYSCCSESVGAAQRACNISPNSRGCSVLLSCAAFGAAQQARRLADAHAVKLWLSDAISAGRAGGGGLVACKALGNALLAGQTVLGLQPYVSARRALAAALHWLPNASGSWSDVALAASRSTTPLYAVRRAAEAALRMRPLAKSFTAWSVHAVVVLRGAVPPVGDFAIPAEAAAAAESSLSHAAQLGGAGGAAAAVALARLYVLLALGSSPLRMQLLSAADYCLQAARSQPSGTVGGATWLATALLNSAGERRDSLALLAALQAASAEGCEPEADARLAAALLAQPDPLPLQALAPACRAAAWRPACWRSASVMAGALHARALHEAAAAAYASAARLAGSTASAECLLCAGRDCAAAAAQERASAAQLAAAGADAWGWTSCAAALFARQPLSPLNARMVHAVPSLPLAYARAARDACADALCAHSSAGVLWQALHAQAACSLIGMRGIEAIDRTPS